MPTMTMASHHATTRAAPVLVVACRSMFLITQKKTKKKKAKPFGHYFCVLLCFYMYICKNRSNLHRLELSMVNSHVG